MVGRYVQVSSVSRVKTSCESDNGKKNENMFQLARCRAFWGCWWASFLPITSPVYLYLLESIGTSRILATHPLASNQKWNRGWWVARGGPAAAPKTFFLDKGRGLKLLDL